MEHSSGDPVFVVVGVILSMIVGFILFVVSFGAFVAVVAGVSSLVSVSISGAIVSSSGQKEDLESNVGRAAMAFIGLALISGGIVYFITRDPQSAGVVIGSNGVVGIAALLVTGAIGYTRFLGD